MRNNKGYQKDWYRYSWRNKERRNSWANGENKTREQILKEVNANFDHRVETCKKEYEKISKKTTLIGKELRKYCRNWLLWEVQFDDELNLIPLEKALEKLENQRERSLASTLYGAKCHSAYQKRIVNKDNQKFVYNTGSGGSSRNSVRIPSMKRSNTVWKRFYELFPYYKEHYNELTSGGNALKLKKIW